MKLEIFPLRTLIATALLTVSASFAADHPATQPGIYAVTERLDSAMLRRNGNFGYTDAEIKKYFDYPQIMEFDTRGLAVDRIKSPPPVGVHPRVLFHPDDLPALRRKLTDSEPAKLQMDAIRALLKKDLTDANATYGAIYDAAAAGQQDPKLLDASVASPVMYELFRCLIDQDQAGGEKAAAALTTLAVMDTAALDKAFAADDAKNHVANPPIRDFQPYRGFSYSGLFGLAYDVGYGFMNTAQRDTVRKLIAKNSAGMTLLCADGLPAFPANVSNWIPMHMCVLLLSHAIEGEPGYDPSTIARCVAGYKRYLSVSMFPAGDMYESLGKNFLCAEDFVPLADRGTNLLAFGRIRSQITNYFLNAMDPWGGKFTFYDSLGGRGNNTPMSDVLILKHLYPNDAAIDFVYRNTVGENYAWFGGQIHLSHPMGLTVPMTRAIFAEEYLPKTWDQAHADATAGKPLTFFSNDTGNLITRDTWDKDALQLHFMARSVSGGHQYADRTHFSIHALGRYWAIYKPLRQIEGHDSPENRSVVLIDGEGPDMTMGRVAALSDTADATVMVADAKIPWEWKSGSNDRFPKGGQHIDFTANDFRLFKSDLPWMKMPFSDLPYWQTSRKGAENWIPRTPIVRAFRTAGLVRGVHPYVIIADDIQKDQAAHNYVWNLILEDDLVLAANPSGSVKGDIILNETDVNGQGRHMLVRTLNANGLDAGPPTLRKSELPNGTMKPFTINRLRINAHTISPDFRTLLFPYRDGQPLPSTTWNDNHTELKVAWSDQVDTLRFTLTPEGYTQITTERQR